MQILNNVIDWKISVLVQFWIRKIKNQKVKKKHKNFASYMSVPQVLIGDYSVNHIAKIRG